MGPLTGEGAIGAGAALSNGEAAGLAQRAADKWATAQEAERDGDRESGDELREEARELDERARDAELYDPRSAWMVEA